MADGSDHGTVGVAPGSAGTAAATDAPGHDVPDVPPALVELVQRIEGASALDRPGAAVERLARAVARPGPARDALTGTWLGHALHPLMTDFPLGLWLSTSLLDLVGGRRSRPAAQRLLAFGVLAAVPTAATGLAEWLYVDRPARRVGVVHAGVNTMALALYTASLRARWRGRHGRGVLLGIAGGLTATAGGYLGGHLTLARKEGSRDPRFAVPAGGRQ